MKKTTLVGLVLILAIALASGHVVSQFLPNSEDEIHYWQQRVKKLEEEKKQSQPDAARISELEKKLSDSEKEAARVPELEKKLSDSEKKCKKLAKQLKASGNKKNKQDDYLLSLFFKKAKHPYEMRDPSFKFYSDPSCDEKYLIEDEIIFSGYQDYPLILDLESGDISCYVTYSSNRNAPVFSKPEYGSPSLNAIKN